MGVEFDYRPPCKALSRTTSHLAYAAAYSEWRTSQPYGINGNLSHFPGL